MIWPNCKSSPEIKIYSSGHAILIIEENITNGTPKFLELEIFAKPISVISISNINIINFARIFELIIL